MKSIDRIGHCNLPQHSVQYAASSQGEWIASTRAAPQILEEQSSHLEMDGDQ